MATRALDLLTTDAALADDVGSRVEHGAGLTDRQNVLPEIRLGKIAVVHEDPALHHGRNKATRGPDGVTLAVGSNGSPADPAFAMTPRDPRRRPGIAWNPEPAKVGIIIPTAIVVDRPGEGFRGLPIPAVIGPEPTPLLIGTPAAALPMRQPDIRKVRVSNPAAVTPELIIEGVSPPAHSRAHGARRGSRCQRGHIHQARTRWRYL
jgi:hypothetical protein